MGFSFFLGRRLGDLFYYFDLRHRAIVYANLKTAFTQKLEPYELDNLTKKFYRSFGQNFIEIFLIPSIGKEYINKYVTFEGADYTKEAFKKNKGVIFLGIHEGGWELSGILSVYLGLPFNLFVRQQRFPRLNRLLNEYRRLKGCRIIQRQGQMRQLIQILKSNQAIGMSADQGGEAGTSVKFFGKTASMSSGAVKLGIKYSTLILPVFYTRINGPYIKVAINAPFEIKKSGDLEKDIADNLQRVINVFEGYIRKYPYEYLWSYKIWKYSDARNILILSDGKAGHLRQAEAAAEIIRAYLKGKNVNAGIQTLEVKLRSVFSRYALVFCCSSVSRYRYKDYLYCLQKFIDENSCRALTNLKPDIIVSCGSSLAAVNYMLSKENLAKSVILMRPGLLSPGRFDLAIMPYHDNPPKRKNIAVTEGALNLINDAYLKEQSAKLAQVSSIQYPASSLYIGLFIGGDTKEFKLKPGLVKDVIGRIKDSLEKLGAEILVTTSRRTSLEVESIIKDEFHGYPRCKLLVIANENNPPFAAGGILGLSRIIVSSPESISMISEAVKSKKYVVVFNFSGLHRKHRNFLKRFSENRYIYLTEADGLSRLIEDIWKKQPQICYPQDDSRVVEEALARII